MGARGTDWAGGGAHPGEGRPAGEYPGDDHPGDVYRGGEYPGDEYPGDEYPGDDADAAEGYADARAGGGRAGRPPRRHPLDAGRGVRALRALSGAFAAGLVLLAAGIVVVSILGGRRGIPGPGTEALTVHLVAAAAGLVLQRIADRRAGAVAALCSVGVLCVAGAVLWTQWWG